MKRRQSTLKFFCPKINALGANYCRKFPNQQNHKPIIFNNFFSTSSFFFLELSLLIQLYLFISRKESQEPKRPRRISIVLIIILKLQFFCASVVIIRKWMVKIWTFDIIYSFTAPPVKCRRLTDYVFRTFQQNGQLLADTIFCSMKRKSSKKINRYQTYKHTLISYQISNPNIKNLFYFKLDIQSKKLKLSFRYLGV